jgi:hypothetical protein
MENETPTQCIIPIHKPNRRELIFFFASGILVSIPFATFFESLVPAGLSAALHVVVLAPFVVECYTRSFNWFRFWRCGVCRVRFSNRCTHYWQYTTPCFSCFKCNLNRFWHSKKESVTVLLDCGVASHNKQLFCFLNKHNWSLCASVGFSQCLPFSLVLFP